MAVPADKATRDEIIRSVDRSMLVEAAAGTGKTTLVVKRVLHGLRAGKFRLARTVAITFTEKAAAELESRIRASLARQRFDPSLSPQERANLERALVEIDQAHISTIHSFCAGLLQAKPVEAGVDPQFEVMDETQSLLMREDCWQVWMSGQLAACPQGLASALRAGVSVEAASRHTCGLKELAFALVDWPEVLEEERFRLSVPDLPLDEALARVRHYVSGFKRFLMAARKSGGNQQYRELIGVLNGLEAVPDHESGALAWCCKLAVSKAERAESSLKKESREEFRERLSQIAVPAAAAAAHLAGSLVTWLKGFARFFQEEKKKLSVVDFKDLLLLSALMLKRNHAVRRYFKKRFDVFFVDEFQDTDPLQAELIAFLCESEGKSAGRMEEIELKEGKLFVVGDPKQSIYRFRRADVQLYEQCKAWFRAGEAGAESVRRVYQNFRSTAPVIESVNSVFEKLLQPLSGTDVYQAAYIHLEPWTDGCGLPEPVRPALWAVCPPPSLVGTMKSMAQARRYEAAYVARAIVQTVQGRIGNVARGGGPRHYRDFACLFSALTDVELYEAAFDRWGIPYRVVGGKNFYAREEIAETFCLLRAVDDPLDEISIVGALRSSYFGVSDEELLAYKKDGGRWNYMLTDLFDGPVGEAMKSLRQWHSRRNSLPPQVLLSQILDRTKALESFLMKPLGEQRVANIEKLLGQIRSVWYSGHTTFRRTVQHLADVQERRLAEEESATVEPGDDFVRIMTIHKSKGLEFDVVVLPDLCRQSDLAPGPVLLERRAGRFEVGLGKGVQSADYQRCAQAEILNLQAERARLLYVAATRAKSCIMLPLHWTSQRSRNADTLLDLFLQSGCFQSAEDVPYGQERGGVLYMDTVAWEKEIDVTRRPRRAPRRQEPGETEELLRAREAWLDRRRALLAAVNETATFVLPSSLVGERDGSFSAEEGDGAGGREFGALFHNLMKRLLRDGWANGDGSDIERMARLEAAHVGLGDDDARAATELAAETLNDAQFSTLLRNGCTRKAEAGFCVPLERLSVCPPGMDGFLEGSIDLLLIGEDRTHIVDYKTESVTVDDAGRAAARYWPQLALYALAAGQCGLADGQVELIVYFVRPGVMVRRMMDETARAEVEHLLRRVREQGGAS